LKTDDKGISSKEHLEQVRKMTGHAPEGLENPTEFPKLLKHVWSFFLQLHQSRTAGFSGPNPITYSELKAWSDMTANVLHAYDVETIKKLDTLYLRTTNG